MISKNNNLLHSDILGLIASHFDVYNNFLYVHIYKYMNMYLF